MLKVTSLTLVSYLLWFSSCALARFPRYLEGVIATPRKTSEQLMTERDDTSTKNTNTEENIPREVKLPLGKVKGVSCFSDDTVTTYYGIPFAKPPISELRFKPPIMYDEPYPNGTLDGSRVPPPCGSKCANLRRDRTTASENCLFLNIWVPKEASLFEKKLPVRVFIHGGDLVDCSASDGQWNGCNSASKGNFIHVNIQFRLGAFGLYSHPSTFSESNTTGSWGLLDQQLALKWIQGHISYFGGDPTQVLLFGHSRGAQMVDFQMVSPGSEGLFRAAISQSAPCVFLRTLEEAYNDSRTFAKAMGCHNESEHLACMRALPYKFIMNVTTTLQMEHPLDLLMCDVYNWHPNLHPVVDGTVVPLPYLEALKVGKFNKVPYMTGLTTEEAGGMGMIFFYDGVNNETVVHFLEKIFPGADPTPILAAYPIEDYSGAPQPYEAQLGQIWTDAFYTCPTHRRLVARSNNADSKTYFYWWGASPSCPPESTYVGPSHGTDLWYTFGITDGFSTEILSLHPDGLCSFNKEEKALSSLVLHIHREMAETGIPTWTDGTPLAQFDPISEMGTYLNVNSSKTERISFSSRCTLLYESKQISTSR